MYHIFSICYAAIANCLPKVIMTKILQGFNFSTNRFYIFTAYPKNIILKILRVILSPFLITSLFACNQPKLAEESKINSREVWVTMLVEIPAGTVDKYELNKTNSQIERDSIDGEPRTINYLGYPANYGMIRETVLPYELGGDGDPLDIISIGPPAKIGETIDSKIIGVLKLKDNGEQDDKLIGINRNSSLSGVNSLQELDEKYPGISTIIETWFTYYKGKGMMVSSGYKDKNTAEKIYSTAKQSF
ncbi:MAG: inorganic pyrophosphatase [Vicingaceae bacterium]|jgi:inorganic pyrophosphatase